MAHKIWEISRYSNLPELSKSYQNRQKLWKHLLNPAVLADPHPEVPNLGTGKDLDQVVAQSELHLPIDLNQVVARAGALLPQRQLPGCVAVAATLEPQGMTLMTMKKTIRPSRGFFSSKGPPSLVLPKRLRSFGKKTMKKTQMLPKLPRLPNSNNVIASNP